MKSVILSDDEIVRFLDFTKNLRHEIPHEYERVRVKDGRVFFILYETGSLVFNENEDCLDIVRRLKSERGHDYEDLCGDMNSHDNRGSYKAKNKKDMLDNSDSIIDFYEYTIGSDETGKGEWYGPLVITAVCTSYDENSKLKEIGIKDSKKISKNQIIQLYKKIKKLNIHHETIILKPYSYNQLYEKFKNEGKNLNHLLAYLHSTAITRLLADLKSSDVLIIIDKFDYDKMNDYLDLEDTFKVIQESDGERFIPVATASIIAKYNYEKTLKEIEERYNISLRKCKPKDINKNIIDKVAKTHFKNVKPYTK